MARFLRVALAALALATIAAACTPSGSAGFVPAAHLKPMDGGGGLPPPPTPPAPLAPTP